MFKKQSAVLVLVLGIAGFSQTPLKYQQPPAAIEQLLDAPIPPLVHVSPDRTLMAVELLRSFPSIAEIAQPRYRLAGLRFNPATNGPSREVYATSLSLQPLAGGSARKISGLPANLKLLHLAWSPNGKHIAFVQKITGAAGAGQYLFVVDAAAAQARQVSTLRLNSVMGTPCEWMPDSAALLCRVVPAGRGAAPVASTVPIGPNVEENLGKVSPGRTYEDMLRTTDDEKIFEYYATSQLALIPLTGTPRLLAVKGVIDTATPSPDGKLVLVSTIHRPFSYVFPADLFPLKTEVVNLRTGNAKQIFDRPLVDSLPIAFDADPPGPREFEWRADVPATLTWIEAGDGGDPKKDVEIHDRLMAQAAPFDQPAITLLESPLRLRSFYWSNDHLALGIEQRWSDRKLRMLTFDPSAKTTKILYEGSSQDRYHNPGRPLTVTNAAGRPVMQLTADGSGIYLIGPGASPSGDKPFLGVMPVGGGEERRVWQSADPYYAEPVALLGDGKVLVRRESQTEPPNYFLMAQDAAADAPPLSQVTKFPSPYGDVKLPVKQLLKYKRADGVDLTATLWLPAGYDKSQGPLPTLMEAYPAEFKTRAAASQVAGSPNRFPRIIWASPVFFTATGYAVLENAAIPIVGEGTEQPNDTYIQQLVAGAKAAIDYGASLGVVDPKRVAVMATATALYDRQFAGSFRSLPRRHSAFRRLQPHADALWISG